MTSFAEMGVQPALLKSLTDLNFTDPTPVQEKVIPWLLREQGDLIALAQTGTGKTAAFGIPLLQMLDAGRPVTQALVLCPTRELCMQVARDLGALAGYLAGVAILPVYGGAWIEGQIKALRQGVHIVVATPGRLCDLLKRGSADLAAIRYLVLDEADEMLNMGFQEEVNAILAKTPAAKNTLLFSATMSQEVAAIAGRYMKKPQEIVVGRRNSGAENVRHLYYMVRAKDRYPALKRIVDVNPDLYALIFCRTRQETQEVADKLGQDGYRADALHGELSQAQRDLVMKKFRRRDLQMLVATDVAARGLDVSDLSHVINYNLPDEIANYTHRSGRTGRAGKAGISVAIIHQRETGKIREIEKRIKIRFEQRPIPSGQEICETRLLGLLDTMAGAALDPALLKPFLPAIKEKLAGFDREELFRGLVAVTLGRWLENYRQAPDLNVSAKEKDDRLPKAPGRSAKKTRAGTVRFSRLFVKAGRSDGLMEPERLIMAINDGIGNRHIAIGRIELLRNFSFIEADSKYVDAILRADCHLVINGRKVKIELAQETAKPPYSAGRGRPPGKALKKAAADSYRPKKSATDSYRPKKTKSSHLKPKQ